MRRAEDVRAVATAVAVAMVGAGGACGARTQTAAAPGPAAPAAAAMAVAPTAPWPVPAGWRRERFALPTDFAPALPRRGDEELRFAPGFAEAAAPDFWSYAFVWRLDDDRPLDAATLQVDLAAYFDGLARAVGAETHKLPAGAGPADVHLVADRERDRLAGELSIWDAFTTGARLTLHLRARVLPCGGARAIVFALSPARADAAIWRDLDALAAAAPCAP